MSKPVKTIFILAVLGVVAFLLITRVFPSSGKAEPTGPARGPMAQKAAVDVFVVSPTAFQNRINSTGTVLPNEEVELFSEVAGRVTGINFQEGTRVRKGQLLLTVNDQEMRAQLQKLQSNQQLYQNMEARQRTLLEKEYISLQEYDQVSNQLATANADIRALKATMDKAYIRAPFDGIIGLRQVSEGSYVSANTPIARIVDVSPVKINFSVPGRYSQMVKVGSKINFSVEGNPETYEAEIYAIEPNIDPATRTMQMRALYPNKNEEIKPGSFARVDLPLKEAEDAILIPTEAIVPEVSGHSVFLAKGGKAVSQKVKIGQRSERLIQILEGIAPGDSIIYSGVLQVRPGGPLSIRKVQVSEE
ncbi:efflux RND transporter periplasmic adaptor subunit [soil metagenome]